MIGGHPADAHAPSTDRRVANAAATRGAIVTAARRLFAEKGYGAARVEDVAALARVSPATVYAQCGGKQGLLRTLVEQWSSDRTLDDSIRTAVSQSTAEGMIAVLGDGAAQVAARWGDVVRLVEQAAGEDADVRARVGRERERRRRALVGFVGRLRATGRLRVPEEEDEVVVDKLLFHLRDQQLVLLIDEYGWDVPVAVGWVVERLQAAMLRPSSSPDGPRHCK